MSRPEAGGGETASSDGVGGRGSDRESRDQLEPAPAEERAQRDAEWAGGSPWRSLGCRDSWVPPELRENSTTTPQGREQLTLQGWTDGSSLGRAQGRG